VGLKGPNGRRPDGAKRWAPQGGVRTGPDGAKRWGAHGEGGFRDLMGGRTGGGRADVEFGTGGVDGGPNGRGGYTH
jgi:hypothetical protein